MSDVKERIRQRAKRRQETEDVCLRGDLAGEYDRLNRELAKLPKNTKLEGDPQRRRIQAEMDSLREQMQADTIPFTLVALPDTRFQELLDEHPPRRDGDEVNEGDAEAGYNRATFHRALIKASTVDPELDEDDWKVLFDEALGPGQVGRLFAAADRVNGRSVDVPFSSADSNENPD